MGMTSLLRTILQLFKAKARGAKLLDLHDDLLREILLRIGLPADLIRASAACNTFRRLVTEPSFSRRYRSTHPPLLLGFLYAGTNCFQPAEAPERNSPLELLRHGCFFWEVEDKDKLVVLDMGIMELSTHDLPPSHHKRDIAIIAEAGKGRLPLFSHRAYDDLSVDYYTTTMQNKSERDNKWQMMNTIPLPANHQNYICGAADGYIFVMGFPRVRGPPVRAVCLSLEVKGLKIERVCNRISGTRYLCHQE